MPYEWLTSIGGRLSEGSAAAIARLAPVGSVAQEARNRLAPVGRAGRRLRPQGGKKLGGMRCGFARGGEIELRP